MISAMKGQFSFGSKSRTRSFFALLLVTALFCSSLFAPSALAERDETTTAATEETTVNQKKLDELKKQQDELDEKIRESEERLAEIEGDIDQQESTIDLLNEQIKDYESQISVLNSRISVLDTDIAFVESDIGELNVDIQRLNTQIADTSANIVATRAEIDETTALLLQRMRATYISGTTSELEILFSAKDISTLLTRSEMLERVAENDQALIDTLESKVTQLNADKAKLGADKEQVEVTIVKLGERKTELQTKQDDLSSSKSSLSDKEDAVQGKYDEANEMLAELDENSKEYEELIKYYAEEKAKVDEQLNDLISEKGSSQGDTPTTFDNDGKMMWPVKYSGCYVSAGYPSYPSGGSHGGIDICVSGGSEGKEISAAQSGTVITSSNGGTTYGKYIVIDHGDGTFTYYAHCKTLKVSVGDTVTKGDIIGLIGSTGNVTGPHLHFEVRIKTSGGSVERRNPLNYVNPPSDCKGYI